MGGPVQCSPSAARSHPSSRISARCTLVHPPRCSPLPPRSRPPRSTSGPPAATTRPNHTYAPMHLLVTKCTKPSACHKCFVSLYVFVLTHSLRLQAVYDDWSGGARANNMMARLNPLHRPPS